MVALVLIWLRPGPRTITLPDGSTLEYLDIQYGTNHTFYAGPSWRRPLTALGKHAAVSNLLSRLQVTVPRTYLYRTTYQDLAVLFRWRASRLDQRQPLSYAVMDEGGNASEIRLFDVISRSAKNDEVYLLCDTPSFPRRGKQFKIDLFDRASVPMTVVGQFELTHPVRGPFPRWKAEGLPQRKRVGNHR